MIKLKLRDYQSDIISRTYQSMASGHHRPLVVSPTGSGKTAMFAWMANAAQEKGTVVWFLVHRKELYDQTIKTFSKFNIPTDIVHIGMVGQVSRNSNKFPEPDLIIFDEGHHASAATWRRIVERFPDAWLIGLTATPCRLDGKPLGEIYDDLVIGTDTSELIRQGYLTDYRLFSVPSADTSVLRRSGKDYDPEAASELMMRPAVYGDVIRHYQKLAPGKRAICFCTTVRHSEAMAAEFNRAGIDAVHFDGTTPKRQRKEIVERFRSGEIQILCNVDLVSEGFDLAACDAAILLRPTQSLSLYLQQVGRALRPADGKTAIILDHVGNALRHGLPDDPRDWSLTDTVRQANRFTEKGELILRTCMTCYAVYPYPKPMCPICGAEYVSTREEIQQIESVQLQELKRAREDNQNRYKERRARELESEADCRSYMDLFLFAKKCGHGNPKRYAIARSYALGFKLPWEKRRIG